jgi:hypothetical protein
VNHSAWSGFDTLHILAGVPSTFTLSDISGVKLTTPSSSSTDHRDFEIDGETFRDQITTGSGGQGVPTKEGLEAVAREARICGEINYVGVVLALACFVGLICPLQQYADRYIVTFTSLDIEIASVTPFVISSCHDSSTETDDLFRYKGSRTDGRRSLSSGV